MFGVRKASVCSARTVARCHLLGRLLALRFIVQERLRGVCKQLNMIDEEMYDLVLMRNEYKVKLGLHSGRVPAELTDIFAELDA